MIRKVIGMVVLKVKLEGGRSWKKLAGSLVRLLETELAYQSSVGRESAHEAASSGEYHDFQGDRSFLLDVENKKAVALMEWQKRQRFIG